MIYKIPIYFEISVEGDFLPADLNAAVDTLLYQKVLSIILEGDRLRLNSKSDIFDTTASKMASAAKVKSLKITPLSKTQVLKKI